MSLARPVTLDADVAIVGSGFAGSMMALALRAQGRSVALIERGRHPRFVIGESSTPLANVLLEELCDRYGLPQLRAFSTWGTWTRRYPEVGRGLKRGFSFFHHRPGELFRDDETHARQLLVAASPNDEVADTHWYRPDFDGWLVHEAQRAGTTYIDGTVLESMVEEPDAIMLHGRRDTQRVDVRAGFVVDASGVRGFCWRALGMPDGALRWMPPTQAVYAHFTGVERWEDVAPRHADDGRPPYPVDAAALHHVFPGGWIWVLRFDNGITSAGAALTDELARDLRATDPAAAWTRLLARVPSVRAQFARAVPVTSFVHQPRVAWRAPRVAGRRWAMLPSAAGVIDPLLSTGFPLTLLGMHRILDALALHWDDEPSLQAALDRHASATLRELDATEQLVAALYAHLDDFDTFSRLTLLYFAAASFSETVHRLGHPERARGFLLCDDERFGVEARACTAAALARPTGAARDALLARLTRAIEPWDVAGLGDQRRRRWHPVLVDDLVAARHKVAATVEEALAVMGVAHA